MMVNPLDLSGRLMLVTGASSGIGRATSVLLSSLGARLILAGRNVERLNGTFQTLCGESHGIEPFDLEDVPNIPGWIRELAEKHGRLSGIVHSAGIYVTQPLRYMDTEELDRVMRVNFAAAVQLAKGFRQKGCSVKPGSIVFVSSVMGLVAQPGISAYCSSKGAVNSLVRSLALELAPEGIRVNAVNPGLVQTELTERLEQVLSTEQFSELKSRHPLGIGQPDDVANAIAFLLADTGRWITGTTLTVDGGYTAQ